MLMSEKTDAQYTGYYISGHPFNCFSTRGEKAIYAPSQKSNPIKLAIHLCDEESTCRASKWHMGGQL